MANTSAALVGGLRSPELFWASRWFAGIGEGGAGTRVTSKLLFDFYSSFTQSRILSLSE